MNEICFGSYALVLPLGPLSDFHKLQMECVLFLPLSLLSDVKFLADREVLEAGQACLLSLRLLTTFLRPMIKSPEDHHHPISWSTYKQVSINIQIFSTFSIVLLVMLAEIQPAFSSLPSFPQVCKPSDSSSQNHRKLP